MLYSIQEKVLMIHFANLIIIGQNHKWEHSHSEERHSNASYRDCLETCTIASVANFLGPGNALISACRYLNECYT